MPATAAAPAAPAGGATTGITSTAPARTAAAAMSRADRGHLWQIDVVRLLTFAAVIAVHDLAFTEQPGNRAVAGAMMLLQYGREVFFALTGFVLVYSAWGRPMRLRSFWKRRILCVAVPYLTWSVLYYAYTVVGPQHATPSASVFGWDLLSGNAEYHLYFLLVTLQLYLAFPFILRLVQRTAHRAAPVLAAVTVVNLAWLAVLQYVPIPSGTGSWFFHHAYELLPTYSMYVLAGCYAAVHMDRLQRFVEERGRALLGAAAAAAIGALVVYTVQLPYMAPRVADDVLQPGMALSCLAAVSVVYLIGSRWAAGPRRHQQVIETLSDASFGVYLAHPFVLQLLLDYGGFGNDGQQLPAALATVFGYVIAVGGGVAISLAARRTPLSLPLAGRPWRAEVKRQAVGGWTVEGRTVEGPTVEGPTVEGPTVEGPTAEGRLPERQLPEYQLLERQASDRRAPERQAPRAGAAGGRPAEAHTGSRAVGAPAPTGGAPC